MGGSRRKERKAHSTPNLILLLATRNERKKLNCWRHRSLSICPAYPGKDMASDKVHLGGRIRPMNLSRSKGALGDKARQFSGSRPLREQHMLLFSYSNVQKLPANVSATLYDEGVDI